MSSTKHPDHASTSAIFPATILLLFNMHVHHLYMVHALSHRKCYYRAENVSKYLWKKGVIFVNIFVYEYIVVFAAVVVVLVVECYLPF